jgi:hypothetical protein
MPITAQCPGCSQTLSVNDEFAGMQGKCPSCGTMVTFPAPGVQATAPPPAPPPPQGDFHQPPAASYAPAPAWQPGAPGYAPPPPRDNTELFTIIGLSAGAFFFLLLLISLFLRWVSLNKSIPSEVRMQELIPKGFSGTHFGDGRLILLFSLVLGAGVGLSFLMRKFLPVVMVAAGAFGTFTFLVMLAHFGKTFVEDYSAGVGIWVGLFAALGIMGACIWTAMRFPLLLEMPGAATQPAFTRTYGALLGSQTLALVLGLVYWIIFAVS